MSKSSVYILESPSLDDVAVGRSEGEMTSQLVKLIGWKSQRLAVTRLEHFESAFTKLGKILNQSNPGFKLLIISAHGCDEGIFLTDGTMVEWESMFPLLGENAQDLTIVFSSCSVLAEDTMRTFLENSQFAPNHVIGFREDVGWSSAAVAVCLILKMLAREERDWDIENPFQRVTRRLNTFAIIWQLLELDIQAIHFFPNGGSGATKGRLIQYSNTTDPTLKGTVVADQVIQSDHQNMVRELMKLGVTHEQFLSELVSRGDSLNEKLFEAKPDPTNDEMQLVAKQSFLDTYEYFLKEYKQQPANLA